MLSRLCSESVFEYERPKDVYLFWKKIRLLSEKLGTKIKIENGIGTVELKEAFH